MRRSTGRTTLLALAVVAAPGLAAPGDTLAANKAASGGSAWDGKETLQLDYAYSGQGLTGTVSSREDLKRGAFVDSYDIGPQTSATGFDGTRAWEKEPSGTVTEQAGGDVVPVAITESYLDRNLWWRKDRGGAAIADEGRKTEQGVSFDVLRVTPRNGKPIEAWFDAKTHLLARTVETIGLAATTTSYLDYASVGGVLIAHKLVIDDGSHDLQTQTLRSAVFSKTQALDAYSAPAEDLHDYSIAGGAHETAVPFRLINNHIYAEASVNGSKPMLFVLDSGGHSILTPDTARALGLKPSGSQTMTGTGDGFAQSGLSTVRSIRIGGAEIRNQPVTVLNFVNPAAEGVTEKGMVGYEFFARFVTRFDYARQTVTFIDKRYFNPRTAGTPLPFVLFHQLPEVRGTYGGLPGYFGIDTGSRWGLSITQPFAAAHGLPGKDTKGLVAATSWGVGGMSRGFVFRGHTLSLGPVTIASPLTAISTDKGGGGASEAFPNNLGNDIFKRFTLTIDYGRMTLYLQPLKGSIADLGTFDRSGMWINQTPGGFKIVDVDQGGPAAEAGLGNGDVIVSVDGKPAVTHSLDDMRGRLRKDPPGTVVAFGIRRDGKVRPVKLVLRDLI